MGYKPDSKKPGTWVAWYSKRHPITKVPVQLRRKGFKSLAAARKAEKELVVAVENKIRAILIPTWSTVLEELPIYMRQKGLAEKTIDNYSLCLKAHTLDLWGERLVDSISAIDIRDFIASKNRSSESQQKSLLKFVRAGMKYSLEKGYIKYNPTPEIRFRKRDKIQKVLTEPQAKLLLTKAKELEVEWYYHWCVALYTGMRNGELYALAWDKVDFEQRQILVNSSWNNKDGFKDTKSGDDRIVEISPTLLTVLRELKLLGKDERFVLPRLGKWDKGEQARELRLFLLGLGLPAVRFHDLRATWATMMLGKGIPPIMVMKMGGWKDIKTMQIYARKAGVDIKGITDRLNLHDPLPQSKGTVLKMGYHHLSSTI